MSESIRQVRRRLKERAQQHHNYPAAIAAARQLGFGCDGYRPRSLLCRLLGFHVQPFATRTFSSDGSWSIDASCCHIGGTYYPRWQPTLPPSLWQRLVAWLRPKPRLKPASAADELAAVMSVSRPALPPLWQPGDSAFWLDPELWSRTPEVNGRPAICWMFLEDRPRKTEKPIVRNDGSGWAILERAATA